MECLCFCRGGSLYLEVRIRTRSAPSRWSPYRSRATFDPYHYACRMAFSGSTSFTDNPNLSLKVEA